MIVFLLHAVAKMPLLYFTIEPLQILCFAKMAHPYFLFTTQTALNPLWFFQNRTCKPLFRPLQTSYVFCKMVVMCIEIPSVFHMPQLLVTLFPIVSPFPKSRYKFLLPTFVGDKVSRESIRFHSTGIKITALAFLPFQGDNHLLRTKNNVVQVSLWSLPMYTATSQSPPTSTITYVWRWVKVVCACYFVWRMVASNY